MTAEGSNKDKEEQERGSTGRKEQVRAYVRDRAGERSVGGAQSACTKCGSAAGTRCQRGHMAQTAASTARKGEWCHGKLKNLGKV